MLEGLTQTPNPEGTGITASPRVTVAPSPTPQLAAAPKSELAPLSLVEDAAPVASWTSDTTRYSFYAISDNEGTELRCDVYLRVTDGVSDSIGWNVTERAACHDLDWAALDAPESDRDNLHLAANWSDLNRNGWPEYSVVLEYSCGGCDDANSGRVAHFEINPDGTAVDIAPASGALVQTYATGECATPFGLTYKGDPTLLLITTLEEWSLHRYVEVPGLIAWRDHGFVNVSREYPGVIREWMDEAERALGETYGQPLTASATEPLWRLLVLYNASGFGADQARDGFLKASDLHQWPGTDQLITCWIQVNRASVQSDAEAGRLFRAYRLEYLIENMTRDPTLAHLAIDAAHYDVSACET